MSKNQLNLYVKSTLSETLKSKGYKPSQFFENMVEMYLDIENTDKYEISKRIINTKNELDKISEESEDILNKLSDFMKISSEKQTELKMLLQAQAKANNNLIKEQKDNKMLKLLNKGIDDTLMDYESLKELAETIKIDPELLKKTYYEGHNGNISFDKIVNMLYSFSKGEKTEKDIINFVKNQ